MKRSELRKILPDVTEEQIKAILDLSHDETDQLRETIDNLTAERDKAKSDLTAATEGRTKAEKDLNDYKTAAAAKETRAGKEKAYREVCKAAGIADKYIATVIKASGTDIDALELTKEGGAKGADKLTEKLKGDWADFVQHTEKHGATVPPSSIGAGGSSNPTRESIMAIKDTSERQAAIAENIELFK